MPVALRRALPDPLRRALDANRSRIEEKAEQKAALTSANTQGSISAARALGEKVKQADRSGAYEQAATILRGAAIDQLQERLKSALNKTPQKRVLVSDTGPLEHRLLAVFWMADALRLLGNWEANPLPSYVADFSKANVSGGISINKNNQVTFSLVLMGEEEDGHLRPGANIIGLVIPESFRSLAKPNILMRISK